MNSRTRRHRVLVWSLTGVYWVSLFVVTHLPPSRVPRTRVSDKLEHFVTYAVLAALLMWSLRQTSLSRRAAACWVVGVCLIYGVIDELTQILVGRRCSLQDWLADAAGAVSAAAVAALLGMLRRRAAAP